MTTKAEFEEAFTAVVDAMTAAPSPKPHGTKGIWTKASLRADFISRADAKWSDLPKRPAGAAGARRNLVAAKAAVDGADYASASSVRSALDLVDTALEATEGVLG